MHELHSWNDQSPFISSPHEGETYSLDSSTQQLPKEILQEKIQTQSRKLIVLIHPFYQFYLGSINPKKSLIAELTQYRQHSDTVGLSAGSFSSDKIAYLEKLLRLLRLANNNVLLLGEELGKVNDSVRILRRQGYRGDILKYATFFQDSEPVVRGGYRNIYNQIVSLGVKELIVAGQIGLYPPKELVARDPSRGGNMIVYKVGSSEVKNIGAFCIQGFIEEMSKVAKSSDSVEGLEKIILSPVVCNY